MPSCFKHPRPKKERKRMNPIGKVGRRRLNLSRELTAEAKANDRDFCELAPVLQRLGIDSSPCFGPLTNAHSMKSSERMQYTKATQRFLDRETCRGCEHHHYDVTDHQTHAMQLKIVKQAIRRRKETINVGM